MVSPTVSSDVSQQEKPIEPKKEPPVIVIDTPATASTKQPTTPVFQKPDATSRTRPVSDNVAKFYADHKSKTAATAKSSVSGPTTVNTTTSSGHVSKKPAPEKQADSEDFMQVDPAPVDSVAKTKKVKRSELEPASEKTDITSTKPPKETPDNIVEKPDSTVSSHSTTTTTTTTSESTNKVDPTKNKTKAPAVSPSSKTSKSKSGPSSSSTPTTPIIVENPPFLADVVKLNVSQFVALTLKKFFTIPENATNVKDGGEYSVITDVEYLHSVGFMYRYYLQNTPPNDLKNDDDFMQGIIYCCAAGASTNPSLGLDNRYSLCNITMENSVPFFSGKTVAPESVRQGEAMRELLCETFGTASVRGALFLMNEMYFYKSLLEYHAKVSSNKTSKDTNYERLLTATSKIIPSPFQYLEALFKRVLYPATVNIVDYMSQMEKKKNRFWKSQENMMTFFGEFKVDTTRLVDRLGYPKFVISPEQSGSPCMISCFPQMVEAIPLLVANSVDINNVDADDLTATTTEMDIVEQENNKNSTTIPKSKDSEEHSNPFKPPVSSMNLSMMNDDSQPDPNQKGTHVKLKFFMEYLCGLFSCNNRKDEILEFSGFPLLRMVGSLFCQPYSLMMNVTKLGGKGPSSSSFHEKIKNGFAGDFFVSPTRLNAILNEVRSFSSPYGTDDPSSASDSSGGFSLVDKSILFSTETLLADLWHVLKRSCCTEFKDQVIFPNSASVFNRSDLIHKKKRKNENDKFGSGIPGLWYSLVGKGGSEKISGATVKDYRVNVAHFTKAVKSFCLGSQSSEETIDSGNRVSLSNWDTVDLPDHGIFGVGIDAFIGFLDKLHTELHDISGTYEGSPQVTSSSSPSITKNRVILSKLITDKETIKALYHKNDELWSLVKYLKSLKEKILDNDRNAREYKASLAATDGTKAKNLRTSTETMTAFKNRTQFLNESSSVSAAVPSISQISVTKKTLAKCWTLNLSQVTTSSSETAMPFCGFFSSNIISKLIYFLSKAPLLFIRNFRIELPDIVNPSDSTETSTHLYKVLEDPNFIKMFFHEFFNWHSMTTVAKSVIFRLLFQMNGQILQFTDSPSSIKKFNLREKRGASGRGVQRVKLVSSSSSPTNDNEKSQANAEENDDDEKRSDSRDEDEESEDIGDEEYSPEAYKMHKKVQKRVVKSGQDSDEEMKDQADEEVSEEDEEAEAEADPEEDEVDIDEVDEEDED